VSIVFNLSAWRESPVRGAPTRFRPAGQAPSPATGDGAARGEGNAPRPANL